MLNEIKTEEIPIKIWADDIDSSTLSQTRNLANFPFAFHHIALMPDAHLGYGMPIGGVMATKNVIIPNAVGVDIGCGMCSLHTPMKVSDIETSKLKELLSLIRNHIPLGFNKQKKMVSEEFMPNHDISKLPNIESEYNNARKQLGTLGGGNHFIEIQKDEDDFIWIMIHSGSRNLGYKIANHHNKVAIELNEKYDSPIPKNHQLDYLFVDSEEGQLYLKEMQYCVDFAHANRRMMMSIIKIAIYDLISPMIFGSIHNVAHNYARLENHFDNEVWVHRKGATSAISGELGIIPGNQGSSSFIVKGKGNKESFESCSHGAGRVMGRKQASRELNLENEIKKLDDLGVIHSIRTVRDLDEASGAYKNITTVMNNQSDLVEIVRELKPLAVIKG